MMSRCSSSISLFALICYGLLFLHCARALPVEAAGRCSPSRICREGLVCIPETPGSLVSVCRETEAGCQVFGCNVEQDQCVCSTSTNCTAQYNFTSLEECLEEVKETNRTPCEMERCPRVWCQPNLQYFLEGECCPICPPLPTIHYPMPTCTENNVHYSEGESWQRDVCVTCTCEAGLPLCVSVQCVIPECELLVFSPGQCCPTCAAITPPVTASPPTCQDSNETYQNGESWQRYSDPCTTCFCVDGETLCASRQCFVVCENPVYLPDTCCPVCPGDTPVPATSTPEPPVVVSPLCEDGGETYQNGESWNRNGDPCTTCQCESGFTLCVAGSCYAGCATEDLVFLPGVCCPVCPGDEGYPPVTTPSTTTTTTSEALPHPSSTSTTQSPTPPPTATTTTTTTATTTTTTTSEEPTLVNCKDGSGADQPHGASWCPTPFEMAICISGAISYTQHHCSIPACQDPSWTPGSCDCPVCPDEVIVISAILAVDYPQYSAEENVFNEHLETLLSTIGLTIVDIDAAEYGDKQTQVVVSVSSDQLEEEELESLLAQVQSPLILSLIVGHHEDPKSIATADRQIQSTSTQTKTPNKITAIAAATVTLAIALLCTVVIVVLIARTHRMRRVYKTVATSKTVTV